MKVQPERVLSSFDAENLALLAANTPHWRREQMQAAFEVFASLSEPTGLEEDWRYVEFDLPFSGLGPALDPGARMEPGPFLSSVGKASGNVVIVDGHVVEVRADGISVFRPADLDAGVA